MFLDYYYKLQLCISMLEHCGFWTLLWVPAYHWINLALYCCSHNESLLSVCKQSFQETPNLSVFPSGPSSPRALLTYTSDVLSKWLALNCPVEMCIFPTLTPQQEKQQSGTDREPLETQSVSVKEGEREKRWLTAAATNGDVRFSGLFLCVLCCLRMLLDVLLKELGWGRSFVLIGTLRHPG